MPVTLVVHRLGSSDDGSLEPVTFDASRILLGRSGSADLRLPDPSVSSRHASIRAHNAGWAVVDEGSTNGTRLNGEKLSPQAPRPLHTGDVLQLGRVTVTVRVGAARPSPASATRELALQLVSRALGDGARGHTRVVVTEGPDAGAELSLAEGSRTIGRDPRCALRLTDRTVPPIALEVVLEGTRVRVLLRDDRASALVGDRVLPGGDGLPWADSVVVTLGETRLRLEDPIARALDESAEVEDEKLAPEELAPKANVAEGTFAGQAAATEHEPEGALSDARPEKEPGGEAPLRPTRDRRRSWRGATTAFEVVALILGLAVLGLSVAGFYWLLRK